MILEELTKQVKESKNSPDTVILLNVDKVKLDKSIAEKKEIIDNNKIVKKK